MKLTDLPRTVACCLAGALLATLLSACAGQLALSGSGAVNRLDLNDDKVASVQRGETTKALVAKLGEPYRKMPFPHLRATAWDYRYIDTFGYLTEISFMIDEEGYVKESIKQRITGGKDDR